MSVERLAIDKASRGNNDYRHGRCGHLHGSHGHGGELLRSLCLHQCDARSPRTATLLLSTGSCTPATHSAAIGNDRG